MLDIAKYLVQQWRWKQTRDTAVTYEHGFKRHFDERRIWVGLHRARREDDRDALGDVGGSCVWMRGEEGKRERDVWRRASGEFRDTNARALHLRRVLVTWVARGIVARVGDLGRRIVHQSPTRHPTIDHTTGSPLSLIFFLLLLWRIVSWRDSPGRFCSLPSPAAREESTLFATMAAAFKPRGDMNDKVIFRSLGQASFVAPSRWRCGGDDVGACSSHWCAA